MLRHLNCELMKLDSLYNRSCSRLFLILYRTGTKKVTYHKMVKSDS